MPVEKIMQIILMVAVIVVLSAFILKAFGIDILGFLEGSLGILGPPTSGKVIHIKTDPGDSPLEVWEFYVTDGEDSKKWPEVFGPTSNDKVIYSSDSPGKRPTLFFSVTNMPTGRCVIFTTDEEGGTLDPIDRGMIYEVRPGTKIDSSCNGGTFESCISGRIMSRYCNLVGKTPGSDPKCIGTNCVLQARWADGHITEMPNLAGGGLSSYSCHHYSNLIHCIAETITDERVMRRNVNGICATDEKVLKEGTFGNAKLHDNCWRDHPEKCNLLGESRKTLEGLKNDNIYEIKFGVICGSDSIWHVCREVKKGDFTPEETINGITYKCNKDGDVFKWEPS